MKKIISVKDICDSMSFMMLIGGAFPFMKKAQAVHVALFTKVPPKNAGAARVFLPEDVLK